MWNLISCSKITEERIRQRSYDSHVQKVNRIKPKIKISSPQQPWFIYTKKKKELKRNQQLMDIEKQNHLLLSKIKHIEKRGNETFLKPSFLTTLNSKIMVDANAQIFKENKRICQKILTTEAFYKTINLMEKADNLQRIMTNISTNARRVQSAKSIAFSKSKITRPESSYTSRPRSSNPFSTVRQRIDTLNGSLSRSKSNVLNRPTSAPFIKKRKFNFENIQNMNVEQQQSSSQQKVEGKQL